MVDLDFIFNFYSFCFRNEPLDIDPFSVDDQQVDVGANEDVYDDGEYMYLLNCIWYLSIFKEIKSRFFLLPALPPLQWLQSWILFVDCKEFWLDLDKQTAQLKLNWNENKLSDSNIYEEPVPAFDPEEVGLHLVENEVTLQTNEQIRVSP